MVKSLGNKLFASIKFTHIQLGKELDAERLRCGPENIFIDSWGQLFLTTNDRVLEIIYNKIKLDYQVLERYRFKPVDPFFIPEIREDKVNHCLLLNYKNLVKFSGYDFKNPDKIYSYNPLQLQWIIDRSGILWLADGTRIVQINLTTKSIRNVIPADQSQIQAVNAATDFYIDRTGIMWIGTGGYGVLKYDPEIELFHHILPEGDTYQILEGLPGTIITNNFQEIKLKENHPVEINEVLDPRSIKNRFPKFGVLSIAKDTNKNLWFGTNGGIISYNLVTKGIKLFNLPPTGHVSLPFPIYADSKNHIWMGYNKNLVCFDPSTGKFTIYDYPTEYKSYEYDFLQTIYEDSGMLWLGSVNGLFCFDLKTKKMVRSYVYKHGDSTTLSNNFVLSFCRDPDVHSRYLWIGTKGGGLNRLDKFTGKFRKFDTKNGLVNNVVYGILPDDYGNLWLSTNKGLIAFNTSKLLFQNFDISDGLQGNEFNRYAYCKTKQGMLVFGGLNGINYFNPKDIRPLPPPKIIFTQLRLFNKPVNFWEPGSSLKKSIGLTQKVVLRYAQNVVTFQFAAMDYRKPGNIRYRYKMEGFDNGFIYSVNVHEATYTNLDPGEYRLIVQASFKNGLWGNNVKSLILVVVPPWYRTWWFYILAVTSTISIIYLLYRERLLQLARLNRLRNRIARDLHDEVGSSVSSIAIYSKIVHDHVDSATFDNEPLLKKIADYATEIMESMNDIVWNINTKNDAFESIISRMREHAYGLFEAKGYILHFTFDENLKRAKLTMEKRRDFYLIYKEALNNIAKYADGKNVWISLSLQQKVINLTIKDDGKGFDKSGIKKSGNGLSNMQHRAKALKGDFTINSYLGKGTEISLKF
jgi:signal transduction histidine kinase